MNDEARNFKAHWPGSVDLALSSNDRLQKAERAIFTRLAPRLAGGAILDIGVASGRTTPVLAAIGGSYVGIDHSDGMIALCRSRHPAQHFTTMHARDIEASFGRDTFDLVMHAFNGIDSYGHEERLMVMSSIYRVLKPGGYFVFSSHNRDFPEFADLIARRPRTKSVLDKLRLPFRHATHAKATRREVIEADYAVVNDSSDEYPIPQYYISIESQRRQLRAVGFETPVDAYGYDGALIDRDREHDYDSGWIYYVARRPDR